jgi:hypothetical protein
MSFPILPNLRRLHPVILGAELICSECGHVHRVTLDQAMFDALAAKAGAIDAVEQDPAYLAAQAEAAADAKRAQLARFAGRLDPRDDYGWPVPCLLGDVLAAIDTLGEVPA